MERTDGQPGPVAVGLGGAADLGRADQQDDERDRGEDRVDDAARGVLRSGDRVEQPDADAGDERDADPVEAGDGRRDQAAEHEGRAEHAEGVDALGRPEQDRAKRGDAAGQRPGASGDLLGRDARRPCGVRVGRRGPDGRAEPGPLEQHEDGDDDQGAEDEQRGVRRHHDEVADLEIGDARRRGVEAADLRVGVDGEGRDQQELGQQQGDDDAHETRLADQTPNDRRLGGGGQACGEHDADDEGRPVGHAVGHDEGADQCAAEGAERALREVDEPAHLVDEHQAHREQAVRDPDDDPLQHGLGADCDAHQASTSASIVPRR